MDCSIKILLMLIGIAAMIQIMSILQFQSMQIQSYLSSTPETKNIISRFNKTNITFASFIVIPNFYIKRGHHSIPPNDHLLTLCSICSLDLLPQAQTLAINYKSGPLSFVAYIDEDITSHTVAAQIELRLLLDGYFQNISAPYDISIGLVYINKSAPFWLNFGFTKDTLMGWKVPKNAMRNLAEYQVATKFLMTVDIDFELYSFAIHDPTYLNAMLTKASAYSNRTIFIVPAFAIDTAYVDENRMNYNNLTRAQLIPLVADKQILPFYAGKTFQQCTDYSQWYGTESDYAVHLQNIKLCNIKYEPYFIVNSDISRQFAWDGRFVGYHLNKIQRMQLLRYHQFAAIVMRDAFMIHVNRPHKHHGSYGRYNENRHRHILNCFLCEAYYYNYAVYHGNHSTENMCKCCGDSKARSRSISFSGLFKRDTCARNQKHHHSKGWNSKKMYHNWKGAPIHIAIGKKRTPPVPKKRNRFKPRFKWSLHS